VTLTAIFDILFEKFILCFFVNVLKMCLCVCTECIIKLCAAINLSFCDSANECQLCIHVAHSKAKYYITNCNVLICITSNQPAAEILFLTAVNNPSSGRVVMVII